MLWHTQLPVYCMEAKSLPGKKKNFQVSFWGRAVLDISWMFPETSGGKFIRANLKTLNHCLFGWRSPLFTHILTIWGSCHTDNPCPLLAFPRVREGFVPVVVDAVESEACSIIGVEVQNEVSKTPHNNVSLPLIGSTGRSSKSETLLTYFF